MDELNRNEHEHTEKPVYEPNFILKDEPAAEKSEAPSQSKPAGQSEPSGQSEVSEVLKAARARADALKAAAAKVDASSEPYRRETGELGEDPVFGRGPANAGAGTSGASASGNPASGSSTSGHPTFENPSFDPGKTGHYTDPRDHFRTGSQGASASWSNGEVRRSHKQVKDQLHKQKKQKKPAQPVTLSRKGLALLIAACMLVSCLFGLGGAALATTMLQKNMAQSAQQTSTSAAHSENATAQTAGYTLESATDGNMTIKEITAATKNSVVEIRTESVASDTWMQQYVTEGAGSGVIISEDGYVMTNNHVIEGASKIKVTTADEKEYQATLIGADETNDVAVLKIDASGLNPVTYGNSDELEVGDLAVAIGNPLGELGGTVTAGIISATDRALAIDGKTLHLLQTDSSINPGNSGGGLFNGSGQLIGLVVAKSAGSDVEGLGFAIPVNTAANVAQQLIDKGFVSGQPSTGMTYKEGSTGSGSGSDPFSQFDSFFGSGTQSGVYIYSVNGENAKKAGFEAGDQVYAVDGKEITTFDELSSIVTAHKVGDTLKFTIIRDGVQKNIKLELEEKTSSQDGSQSADQDSQSQNGQSQDGQGQNGQMPDFENGQGSDQLPDSGSGGFNFGFGLPDFFDLF